jgi:hypothetical protein
MQREAAGWVGGWVQCARNKKEGMGYEREENLALAVDVGRHDTQDVGEGICFKNEGHVETGRCGVSCN